MMEERSHENVRRCSKKRGGGSLEAIASYLVTVLCGGTETPIDHAPVWVRVSRKRSASD